MARSAVTPAARARLSMPSRSSANCGKSMCACESISSISEILPSRSAACCAPTNIESKSAWQGVAAPQSLLESCADFDVFVGEASEDRAAFGADGGGDDHAVGFDAAKLARREIDDHGDFAADQFFWLIELRDAGANLANLRADIDGELKQLVRADDALGGLNLPDAHLHFGKVLNADLFRGGRRSGRGNAARGWRARSRRGGNTRRLLLCFVFHSLHPLDCLCFFDSREELLRLAERCAGSQMSPAQFV